MFKEKRQDNFKEKVKREAEGKRSGELFECHVRNLHWYLICYEKGGLPPLSVATNPYLSILKIYPTPGEGPIPPVFASK